MKAEEFWVEDYSERPRQIISDYTDKMNFAEAYAKQENEELKELLYLARWNDNLLDSENERIDKVLKK